MTTRLNWCAGSMKRPTELSITYGGWQRCPECKHLHHTNADGTIERHRRHGEREIAQRISEAMAYFDTLDES